MNSTVANSVNELPILFKAPMVRAIQDGNKLQTRRLFSERTIELFSCAARIGEVSDFLNSDKTGKNDLEYILSFCPYGKVGDQLWVRETFQPIFADGFDHDSSPCPNYKTGFGYAVSYPATDGIIEFVDGDENITSRCKPSIFMPRWASRIQLEITNIRVQRLQDISEDDAAAEGIEGISQPTGGDDYQDYWRNYALTEKEADGWPWFNGDPIASFKSLWEKMNGIESWQLNPWVWVIEFKRV